MTLPRLSAMTNYWRRRQQARANPDGVPDEAPVVVATEEAPPPPVEKPYTPGEKIEELARTDTFKGLIVMVRPDRTRRLEILERWKKCQT